MPHSGLWKAQQRWRELARQAVLRGKRVAVLPPAAYGGHTDANEAWVAGVLTLSGMPPVGATSAAALALPEGCREEWEERAAIIEWDGHMPRATAERLAWAMLPHQLQQE